MEVLDRIFSELKKAGKSQVELADFLGLHKNNITDWKAGRSKSYMKYLYQIAAFFQLEVGYFLGKTEYPKAVFIQPISDDLHQLIDLLDIEDRAELKGTVKQMLKSDKYKEKDSASNVG